MKRCVFVLSIVLASIAALVVPTAAAHTGTRAAGTRVSASQPADTGSRQKINFDREWKFVRSDATGAQASGFDDSPT